MSAVVPYMAEATVETVGGVAKVFSLEVPNGSWIYRIGLLQVSGVDVAFTTEIFAVSPSVSADFPELFRILASTNQDVTGRLLKSFDPPLPFAVPESQRTDRPGASGKVWFKVTPAGTGAKNFQVFVMATKVAG